MSFGDAFERFALEFHQYYEQGWRLAYRILRNAEDAEDALQQALINCTKSACTSGNLPPNPPAFFLLVVHNESVRILEKRGRERAKQQKIEGGVQFVHQDQPNLPGEAKRCLDELAPDLRMTVLLRVQCELKPDEIAETLGIPLGTVRSRLHRAMQMLRACIQRRSDPEGDRR